MSEDRGRARRRPRRCCARPVRFARARSRAGSRSGRGHWPGLSLPERPAGARGPPGGPCRSTRDPGRVMAAHRPAQGRSLARVEGPPAPEQSSAARPPKAPTTSPIPTRSSASTISQIHAEAIGAAPASRQLSSSRLQHVRSVNLRLTKLRDVAQREQLQLDRDLVSRRNARLAPHVRLHRQECSRRSSSGKPRCAKLTPLIVASTRADLKPRRDRQAMGANVVRTAPRVR